MTPAFTPNAEDGAKRILRARIALTLRLPFLSSALMQIRADAASLTDASPVATDGWRILYDPARLGRLSDAELRGLIAHVLLHVLLEHALRRGDKKEALWNRACDIVVNLLLKDFGFAVTVTKQSKKFCGLTAEAVYRRLNKEDADAGTPSLQSQAGSPTGGGAVPFPAKSRSEESTNDCNGGSPSSPSADAAQRRLGIVPNTGRDLTETPDESSRPSDPTEAAERPDREKLADLLKEMRSAVADELKRIGRIPGGFETLLRAADTPQIDWRTVLQHWLIDRVKSDWSMWPPSKKYLSQGLYMPSVGVAAPGRIVLAIDTSGSMTERELRLILAEISGFRETFPSELTVIEADAEIQNVTVLEAFEPTPECFPLHGGGGTDFRTVFRYLAEYGTDAQLLIYATDGFGQYPEREPDIPVIWLGTHSQQAVFPKWGTFLPLRSDCS